MLKVMTLVGTRPELIKMSRVIAALDAHTQHVLVHSGQNYDYELNQIFFDELEIRKPDHFLGVAADSPAKTIAAIIEKADEVFAQEMPDALMLYGDTNTCLAAIAAKRRKIPIFHMEAGNRCFDARVPEELNRKVVDHLSDINMVLSEHARRYLLAEGVRPETVIKTGSHLPEVLEYYRAKIEASTVLQQESLTANNYFLVSAHREETVDDPARLQMLVESLSALAETYQYPVLFSTHPRTRKRLENAGTLAAHKLLRFAKPFGFFDYITLQKNAACVLSDSGTLTEEAAILDLPAVMLRDAHERPEGMDEGTAIMGGIARDSLLDSVKIMLQQRGQAHCNRIPADYSALQVSQQIVRIVRSYTGYVNRTVWHKA